jgi:ABC-type transport system involved in multi-copper enzyme maturation permease subunit
MAVLYAMGVVIILAGLSSYSYQITSFIVGPAPDYGGPIFYGGMEGDIAVKGGVAGTAVATANGTGAAGTDSSTPPDRTAEPIVAPEPVPPGPIWDNSEWEKWWDRQRLVQGIFDAISPITNFQNHIAQALISDTSGGSVRPLLAIDSKFRYEPEKTDVMGALASVWMNILALIAEILAVFGIAYVKFLRTDIR